MIFDSHAHYDDKAFDEDRDDLLSNLAARGIEGIVNSGASIASTARTIELAEMYRRTDGRTSVMAETAAFASESGGTWRDWSGLLLG